MCKWCQTTSVFVPRPPTCRWHQWICEWLSSRHTRGFDMIWCCQDAVDEICVKDDASMKLFSEEQAKSFESERHRMSKLEALSVRPPQANLIALQMFRRPKQASDNIYSSHLQWSSLADWISIVMEVNTTVFAWASFVANCFWYIDILTVMVLCPMACPIRLSMTLYRLAIQMLIE